MDDTLVDRLCAHRALADAPRQECEWLARHGEILTHAVGERLSGPGDPIDHLFITLRGHLVFYTERAGNRRKIIEWGAGDLAGLLPYSRMRQSPGEAIVEEAAEILCIHKDRFPEMVRECPTVTASCVHRMLDRARLFTRSDLHDEKMASLGKLAAGLAHELNNPASAAARSADLLGQSLAKAEAAAVALVALDAAQRDLLSGLRGAALVTDARPGGSALDAADREEAIGEWLEAHGSDPDRAGDLAATNLSLADLDRLATALAGGKQLDVALEWLATSCAVRGLTREIEHSARRIHDLVSAVKRVTYMDRAAAPEPISLVQGIRDTVAVLAAKARQRSIKLTVDVPDDLPPVVAYGGELNQVWSNLIDNALDAASSRVDVTAGSNGHLVCVRVLDDGPGIAADALGRIFDPFFTTKPVGQGTGLGLDIVRRIVLRHDGDVSAASPGGDGRTEFRVDLPTAPEGRPAPP